MNRAFLGQIPLVLPSRPYLGEITDPAILAKVNMSEAFANALTAVSKLAYVKPETMSASPQTAQMTFENFLKGGPQYVAYAMKLLVLASVLVKQNIRALGMEPQQLSNILIGADAALKKQIPADQMDAEIKKYQQEIISRAPANIQAHVKELIEGAGVTATNLVPNIPEGASREPMPAILPGTPAPAPAPAGLTDLQKVALVGIPVALAAGIALLVR